MNPRVRWLVGTSNSGDQPQEGAQDMDNSKWAPLYIVPKPCNVSEGERRAAHEYASEHYHLVPRPRTECGNWDYFTTDPTDRHAQCYAIARPDKGGLNSRFGDLAYVVDLYEDSAARYIRDADISTAMANCCHNRAHYDREQYYHDRARRSRDRAAAYRDAAARIRAQWTR